MFITTSTKDNFILNVFLTLCTCFEELLVVHDEDFSGDEEWEEDNSDDDPKANFGGENMTRMMKMTTIMIMMKTRMKMRRKKMRNLLNQLLRIGNENYTCRQIVLSRF